jgi:hypothetical protein
MKKILLFLALSATTTGLIAQPPKWGIKGGLNVSKLTGGEMNSRTGFHVGALTHIHLSPQLALQPEVMYSTQGGKYNISTGEHNLEMNYLNVPFNLQYMFDNGFRIQTGPQIGALINVKDKHQGQETGFFDMEDFKNLDISWTAGLGYLTSSGLGVDARYNFGLNNIQNIPGGVVRKNNVFQVGLFYLFDNQHKMKSR